MNVSFRLYFRLFFPVPITLNLTLRTGAFGLSLSAREERFVAEMGG
jgi:hypothetical protein